MDDHAKAGGKRRLLLGFCWCADGPDLDAGRGACPYQHTATSCSLASLTAHLLI